MLSYTVGQKVVLKENLYGIRPGSTATVTEINDTSLVRLQIESLNNDLTGTLQGLLFRYSEFGPIHGVDAAVPLKDSLVIGTFGTEPAGTIGPAVRPVLDGAMTYPTNYDYALRNNALEYDNPNNKVEVVEEPEKKKEPNILNIMRF